MNPEEFRASTSGKVIRTIEGYWAFVPHPLPPPIAYDRETVELLSDADRGLGRLAGIGQLLPNPHLLITPYIRREAVLSSRIEGTRASLSDLLYFEAAEEEPPSAPDVQEVRNYVRAMEYGLKRLEKLPLSLRLVREIHAQLMAGVRGAERRPGELRQVQNWIGPPGCSLAEATFVPPPVSEMEAALGEWEKFLHDAKDMPPLVQCALMHYQFEAIHPFVDGNGRVGRLLITFFLCERGHLPQPLLYLSAFFEQHRAEYYGRLLGVSRFGDWMGWIKFFLQGIATQASAAADDSRRIIALQRRYRELLQQRKASPTAIATMEELFLNPYVTATRLSKRLKVSFPAVQSTIDWLVKAGVLREITGRQRNRIYCSEELLRAIEGKPASPKTSRRKKDHS
ncbi:MAG: Fic family protein [candidate division NC10 bacterium CSP1-5]|nr:MAG: Fic family protein [candidate division NC10 bacterium CSP1-5]